MLSCFGNYHHIQIDVATSQISHLGLFLLATGRFILQQPPDAINLNLMVAMSASSN